MSTSQHTHHSPSTAPAAGAPGGSEEDGGNSSRAGEGERVRVCFSLSRQYLFTLLTKLSIPSRHVDVSVVDLMRDGCCLNLVDGL